MPCSFLALQRNERNALPSFLRYFHYSEFISLSYSWFSSSADLWKSHEYNIRCGLLESISSAIPLPRFFPLVEEEGRNKKKWLFNIKRETRGHTKDAMARHFLLPETQLEISVGRMNSNWRVCCVEEVYRRGSGVSTCYLIRRRWFLENEGKIFIFHHFFSFVCFLWGFSCVTHTKKKKRPPRKR